MPMSSPPATLDLNRIYQGDCRELLRLVPERSIHLVITSPPYWGLRNYGNHDTVWGGVPGCDHVWGDAICRTSNANYGEENDAFNREQGYGRHASRGCYCKRKRAMSEEELQLVESRLIRLFRKGLVESPAVERYLEMLRSQKTACGAWLGTLGLEPTLNQHLRNLGEIFELVRQVLHPHGVVVVNYGDAYAQQGRQATQGELADDRERATQKGYRTDAFAGYSGWNRAAGTASKTLRPKQLLGLPWRVAFALQRRGWWLRSDIIWWKRNALPESVQDRPGRDHEYVFLLARQARYFYDSAAVRQALKQGTVERESRQRLNGPRAWRNGDCPASSGHLGPIKSSEIAGGRLLRTVWDIPTRATKEDHTATFPPELVRRSILFGTSCVGVCPECKTPLRPVYEKLEQDEEWARACGANTKVSEGNSWAYKGRSRKAYQETGAQDPGATKARIIAGLCPRRLAGADPGCKCHPMPPRPVRPKRPLKPLRGKPASWPAEVREQYLAEKHFYEHCLEIWQEEYLEWAAGVRQLHPTEPAVVLDPFAGSGTTSVVAHELGRDHLGFELNVKYWTLATEQLAAAQAGMALKKFREWQALHAAAAVNNKREEPHVTH